MRHAFTLIELLIVVAIIAILAAIAVPNFLEAQTRSKISRSRADMRSLVTGIEAYTVDYNRPPKALWAGTQSPPPPAFSNWWGFVSSTLTTPIAYMSSLPVMPFTDSTITGFWTALGGKKGNQTYTYLRNTAQAKLWVAPGNYTLAGAPAGVANAPVTPEWSPIVTKSGYILYTGGPDGVDSTVYGSPAFYDATNGTISYGDIYTFGSGTADRDPNK